MSRAPRPGLPEAIASAGYAGGFQSGVRWLLDGSRAVGDSDKLLWLEMVRDSMGSDAAWGAAVALRCWAEQRAAIEARARAELDRHGPQAKALASLLARARQPGAVLAHRLLATARAARRAWEAYR